MTEHKFTDDEIIKALKHCGSSYQGDLHSRCSNCPLHEVDIEPVACFDTFLHDLSLDLINRQKAEIERLTNLLDCYEETSGNKKARAEAIREFAERLKKHSTETIIGGKYKFRTVTTACIDSLVEEMTEGV